MSRGKKTLSPYGCQDCAKAWVDRCGLTGHRQQWTINAKHHCSSFDLDRRKDSDAAITLVNKSSVIENPVYSA